MAPTGGKPSPVPVRLLYTWFGLGYIPKAPGTFGTIGAIPLYFLIMWLSDRGIGPLGGWRLYALATALVFLVGWWACDRGEADFGGHDDKRMVIDEVLGYLVTMFPIFTADPVPHSWLVGFALFRIFDIWKPGPVGIIDQNTPGGLGVMLDDAMAGVLAWCGLQLLWVFFGH
ncbi:MAG: phosphatidylglycerophosphatase A [Deltaproteobacteria bacterium]|jgi:phosphatidylglycerophosphatase A|nr:phosphatidylglycerophosphatase A [Deltaproteobacteria bacterium]